MRKYINLGLIAFGLAGTATGTSIAIGALNEQEAIDQIEYQLQSEAAQIRGYPQQVFPRSPYEQNNRVNLGSLIAIMSSFPLGAGIGLTLASAMQKRWIKRKMESQLHLNQK